MGLRNLPFWMTTASSTRFARAFLRISCSTVSDATRRNTRTGCVSENTYLGLANAVDAVLRLQIHLWIPVAVEKDHGICPHQIDAEAGSTRTQQKERTLCGERALIKLVNLARSLRLRCGAIDAVGLPVFLV